MILKLVCLLFISGLLVLGCSTTTKYDYCISYTTSYSNVAWKPVTYYQKNGNLLIQLPKTINPNFIPEVKILDSEFNQEYKIASQYDESNNRIIVRDNYDKYVLSRKSPDELTVDKVYITCNRESTVWFNSH